MGGSANKCILGFSVCPLAISAIFCGLYWSLWQSAKQSTPDGYDDSEAPFYDMCDTYLVRQGEPLDTKWTFMLALNSMVYLCLTAFTLCLMVGTFWSPCSYVGGCGHFFGGCAQLATIVITGMLRYSLNGKRCADEFMTEDGEKI